MNQNNVRIFGGKIIGKKDKPLFIGTDSNDSRVKELYTNNLNVLGSFDVSTSEASPTVMSVSDDTYFLNCKNILIESENFDIQGNVKINDQIIEKRTNTIYQIQTIRENTTIELDDTEYELFDCDSGTYEVNIKMKDGLNIIKKVFIARKNFKGTVKFNFINGSIIQSSDENICIGLSEPGQSIQLIGFKINTKEEYYLQNTSFEIFYS